MSANNEPTYLNWQYGDGDDPSLRQSIEIQRLQQEIIVLVNQINAIIFEQSEIQRKITAEKQGKNKKKQTTIQEAGNELLQKSAEKQLGLIQLLREKQQRLNELVENR